MSRMNLGPDDKPMFLTAIESFLEEVKVKSGRSPSRSEKQKMKWMRGYILRGGDPNLEPQLPALQ